ncbi:hypothetical protein ES707_13686 [subsurface metagenome]
MTRRQAKIILIDYIGWFCKWTKKELNMWDRIFRRKNLKGV